MSEPEFPVRNRSDLVALLSKEADWINHLAELSGEIARVAEELATLKRIRQSIVSELLKSFEQLQR